MAGDMQQYGVMLGRISKQEPRLTPITPPHLTIALGAVPDPTSTNEFSVATNAIAENLVRSKDTFKFPIRLGTIDYLGGIKLGKMSLVSFINSDVIDQEISTFTDAIRAYTSVRSRPTAHISIGRLLSELCTQPLREIASKLEGLPLQLGPLRLRTYHPKVERAIYGQMDNILYKQSSKASAAEEAAKRAASLPLIRTVLPGTIPPGFLASIRPSEK